MPDIALKFHTESDSSGTEALKASVENLKSSVLDLRDTIAQHAETTKKAAEEQVGFTEKIKDTAREALLEFAAFETLKRGYEAIHEATLKSETAQVKLAGALNATGQFTPQVVTALNAQAAAMSEQLHVSQSSVTQWQAYALQMGVLPGNVDRVVRASQDLSVALGVDQETAIRMVMQATEGHGGALRRIIPTFDETAAKAGGLDNVLKQLSGVHDMAAKAAETQEGRERGLAVAEEEAAEKIGKALGGGGLVTIATDAFHRMGEGMASFIALSKAGWKDIGADLTYAGSLFTNFKMLMANTISEGPKKAWADFKYWNRAASDDLKNDLARIREETSAEYKKIFGPSEEDLKKAEDALERGNQKAHQKMAELEKIFQQHIKTMVSLFDNAIQGSDAYQKIIEEENAVVSKATEDEINARKHFADETKSAIKLVMEAEDLGIKFQGDLTKQSIEWLKTEVEQTKKLRKEEADYAVEQQKKAAQEQEKMLKDVAGVAKGYGHIIGSALGDAIGQALEGKTVDIGKIIQQTLIKLVEHTVDLILEKLIQMAADAVASIASSVVQTASETTQILGQTAAVQAETAAYYSLAAAKATSAAVPAYEEGGVVGLPKAATGAIIGGTPGGGGVPIIAHPGEIVVNAPAVQQIADGLNQGQLPGGGSPTYISVHAMDASSFRGFMGTGQGGRAMRELAVGGHGFGGILARNAIGVSR